MKQHILEVFFPGLIDWSPLMIMGNAMSPRDPDAMTMRKKKKRTSPTNRRSCASQTKTRLAGRWQPAL
jgi:hypothetical protein